MAKTNYQQLRRQKELARKTRKQEKQQKREAAKAVDSDGIVDGPTTEPEGSPGGSSVS